jgi:large subunit ribosomal protein L10
MPTDAKRQAVSQLVDMLRASSALAVADYRGLTVSEMHAVRKTLRANGVRLQVAKNRLLKIAADEAGLEELKPLLAGPTAVAGTSGDEVSLARALQEAFRPYKVVTLRGGLLAGQPISAADLGRLASLPSRDVLLSRLAGGMVAPLSGMASVLAANLRNLVGVLYAVAEQRRQTEITPPTDLARPSEPAKAAEQTEPTDQAETDAVQADQTQTEPAEQTDQADQAETEPAEQTDQADQAETEPAEQTDQTETEPAEQTDQTETEPALQAETEPAEQTDQAETEPTEPTEPTEEIGEPTTDKENV